MALRVSLLLLLATVLSVEGYRHFQELLPNGDQVPHPCKPNFVWRGLGHIKLTGGGPRNVFGLDFIKYGQWTKELCEMDSDGDGIKNGDELGDPNCVWQPGTFPARTTDISHPGICDPWGSPECNSSNTWVSCDTGEFKCDAIHAPDVKNITVRFPPTKVPPLETAYYCMTFDLNLEKDIEYHMIAFAPVIDNQDVMHHIGLLSCNNAPLVTKPAPCYMAQAGCGEAIGIWTLGLPGDCMYKEAGFKLGRNGITRVGLQFHWTNPQRRTDFIDSSGLTLYYTPKLRPYNAGVLFFGQRWLEIPPGQQRVTTKTTCTERCSKKVFSGPIQITTALNHMHYLGYEQQIEQFRDGRKLRDITNEPTYSYDNPKPFVYDPPIEIRPGDSVTTTCTHRSLSRTTTAYFGEGTFDEMCYGLITYYPKENHTHRSCVTWKDFDFCDLKDPEVTGCNRGDFFNASHPVTEELRRKVLDSCNYYGPCRVECPVALAEAKKNPCLQGQLGEFFKLLLSQSQEVGALRFALALTSCDCVKPNESSASPPETSGGSVPKMSTFLPWFLTTMSSIFAVSFGQL